jgi:Putative membrane protein insertion efficiency factor
VKRRGGTDRTSCGPFALANDLGERKSPSSDSDLRESHWYVEPLSDARTLQGERCVSARPGWAGEKSDFFTILLGACPTEPTCSGYERAAISLYGVLRGGKLSICRLLIY